MCTGQPTIDIEHGNQVLVLDIYSQLTLRSAHTSNLVATERETGIVDKAMVSILPSSRVLDHDDSHVNALSAELGEETVDVLLLGHVRFDDSHLLAASLLCGGLDFGKAVSTTRDKYEVSAALGKQEGRSCANAAGRAGDEHCR